MMCPRSFNFACGMAWQEGIVLFSCTFDCFIFLRNMEMLSVGKERELSGEN